MQAAGAEGTATMDIQPPGDLDPTWVHWQGLIGVCLGLFVAAVARAGGFLWRGGEVRREHVQTLKDIVEIRLRLDQFEAQLVVLRERVAAVPTSDQMLAQFDMVHRRLDSGGIGLSGGRH